MKNEAFAPTPELLAKMDAWWRAANYLSACQLFFQLLHGFPVVHIILLIFFIDLFCFVLIVKCLVLLWNRL